MAELTDLQLRCLAIVDAVRWCEVEKLSLYNYHLLRRQLGVGDPVVTFEMEQACAFALAHNSTPPPSPPPGPERSPWMKTWDVPFWRIEAIDMAEPDLDGYAQSLEENDYNGMFSQVENLAPDR